VDHFDKLILRVKRGRLGEGIDWYFDWDTDTRHALRAQVLYIKTLASIYGHRFQNMRYPDQLNAQEGPHEQLMLKQLNVATTTWVQAVGWRGSTLDEALRLKSSIRQGFHVKDKLRLSRDALVTFCRYFKTGTDDSLFRDLYARDLTFRSIWLDFLSSLLAYVETKAHSQHARANASDGWWRTSRFARARTATTCKRGLRAQSSAHRNLT
jgi:hypothetical protein